MVAITEAVMADEMVAITVWAERNGWQFTYDPVVLRGRIEVEHPNVTGQMVTFWVDVAGYPNEQPPAWWCGGDGRSVSRHKPDYPRPAQVPPTGLPNGSVFHPDAVICAPWNRLAYGVHGGPHGDWPALAAWKTYGAAYTQAHTIADMLSTLAIHLDRSDGMLI